jgi:N-acetylglucosamine-6-phosphate deacetylase
MKLFCKNLYSHGLLSHLQMIEVQDGKIVKTEPYSHTDQLELDNVLPGFVDLHINGGEEHHFTHEPHVETLRDIEFSAQKNGVGYTLPTIITSSFENIFEGIESIKTYKNANKNTGVLGMHLEGPFLSVKKRGAHLEKYIQKPTDALLKELIQRGNEHISLLTIAPEYFTDFQLDMLLESDIKISFGHSDASFAVSKNGFQRGVNLVTHLFNAMSALGHREPGLTGAALMHSEVYTPLILDDVHVSKDVAKLAFDIKKEKLFLISDALFQNHKKQHFVWEEFNAKLVKGDYLIADGNLAGATISLADAVLNAVKWLEVPLEKAIQMATEIPAKALNTKRNIGKIEVGYEAKFAQFQADTNTFTMLDLTSMPA